MPGVDDITTLLRHHQVTAPPLCDWCNRLITDGCVYFKTNNLAEYVFCDDNCAREWYADLQSRSNKAQAEAEEVTAECQPASE